jgi:hypothetical protein
VIDQPNLFDQPSVCPTCCRPLGDLDAPGKVGRKHPETSYAAAGVRRGTQRHKVLLALVEHPDGATADTISKMVGVVSNQTATRLLELREGGYVTYKTDDFGEAEEQRTSKGHQARLQVLTPAGLLVLVEIEEVEAKADQTSQV